MTQTQIDFDAPTPLGLGRQGEERAIQAAPESWKAAALEALYRVCRENETWIVDAVWRALEPKLPCPDRRAMAGILSEGEKRGWCRRTEELRRSEQRQCHGNVRSVWRSLIYQQPHGKETTTAGAGSGEQPKRCTGNPDVTLSGIRSQFSVGVYRDKG